MFLSGTRPPSVQRYLHFLNSFHKEVVRVCLIQNIPESEPCSEEDESLQVFILNRAEVDYVLIKN